MSTGRPQGFDDNAVTRRALEQFHVAGFTTTSTRDLSAACGISSSTLYTTLGGKQRMFTRAVELYTRELLEHMAALRSSLPPQHRHGAAFFEALMLDIAGQGGSDSGRRGCLLFNSLVEFGPGDAPEAHQVQLALRRIRRFFVTVLRTGESACGKTPATVQADAVLMSIAGLRTLLRSGLPAPRARAVARHMVRSLFHPQEHNDEH